jgi:hypothetical protein
MVSIRRQYVALGIFMSHLFLHHEFRQRALDDVEFRG